LLHILPELKKLENEFPNNLVVIGVHSAKFETEKVTENIREAMLRYEIVHPVINDLNHEIWDTYGITSWPTICLIDPEGMAVWIRPSEFKAAEVSLVLSQAIPFYREQKLLDEKPLTFDLESSKEQKTPLRFPGKILADEKGNRLFISDSNHNRIVVATLEGSLLEVIGSGEIGRVDGDYKTATFNHPQGCALVGETLYVADTENHLLRKVDLKSKSVATIAGTGEQGAFGGAFPDWIGAPPVGRKPKKWVSPPALSPLNSPWALWVHKTDLYIAMAGYHQIWKMPLDESEIGPHAGNGREDIIDGPILPRDPFRAGAAFAQPSGLSSDGTWLYVADSEGSSIRAVPFLHGTIPVRTVVGSDHLGQGARLFAFGDKDGPKGTARLQHCLEVVFLSGKLYVADTYNHKIKVVDAKTGETKTFAGTGKPGSGNNPAEFHEPAGLAAAKGKLYVADTNNHVVRMIDLTTGKVATLAITGLAAPGGQEGETVAGGGGDAPPDPTGAPSAPKKPNFQGAREEKLPTVILKPTEGLVKFHVALNLPAGWKINPLAPMSYWLDSPRASGPADRAHFGRVKLDRPVAEFDVPLRVGGEGEDEVQISLAYYYCQTKDEGVCKVGSVVFTLPLRIAEGGVAEPVKLTHVVTD
jgi:thioredoxin family protein/NHL repeat-containing protein